MKVYNTNEIRNIALLGNAGSGKTTLAEAMLFEGGLIKRRGDVTSKNTVSDYHEIEHEQEGSVFSTVLYTEWLGKKLNVLDTPGLDDFVGGVVSSLYVTDTALILLNAQNGVEVGAELSFRQTKKMKKPVVFVVNHLDRETSNFEKTVDEARQQFGSKVTIVQYPVNVGPNYNCLVDVLLMKMYKWKPEGGAPEISEVPESEMEKAQELQGLLIEAAAENDDGLMEVFFEKGTLTEDEMRCGIRKGLITRGMFPVFCVNAKADMGVRRLMEFLGNVAPSPDMMPAPINENGDKIKCDVNAPTSLFVFKSALEPHLGEILYFKVMQGEIEEGADLINTNKRGKERFAQLFSVAGKTRTKVTKLVAGDIGASVKLKESKTNHTINEKSLDWVFPPMEFPAPKFQIAIKAVNESDEEKLGEALNRIHEENPTLIVEYSKELKQTILYGQGEFHLNSVKWLINNVYKIDIEFVKPKIPYRETITKIAMADYRHKKQSGGAGQFGEVHLFIEPFVEGTPMLSTFKKDGKEQKLQVRETEEKIMPWGGKLVYNNCIVGGVVDARFMPAILKGIMEKMEEGPLTGSYARDIRVYVYDGKMHDVDSNEISFKIAGSKAFSKAFKEAGPKILEPIYDIQVLVPSDKLGDVMSDLQGRRAVIQGMENEGGYERLKVKVPIAEMFKYSTSLSSITSGRATFQMVFAEYQQVPGDVQLELLKAYAAENQDE